MIRLYSLTLHVIHMSYRIPPIEISSANPFAQDNLNRKDMVDFVAQIITHTKGEPLVLAVDGPYGSGKSTFVSMLQTVLNEQKYQTVYFDAWKADHISDPLIALVAALDTAIPKSKNASNLYQHISKVKKVAGALGKRALIAGVKVGTAGVVDLPSDIEKILTDAAGDSTKDLVDAFQAETKLIGNFRDELSKTVQQLNQLSMKPVLVFFIDELDRCRPDFAITLLERVKHMFDVPNAVFILSVDKAQLEGATLAIYGDRINASEYLRKFIDLEFSLDTPSSKEFISSAITRAGIDDMFAERTSELSDERDQFVRFFTMLTDLFNLGLRSQERCIVRLKLVLNQTNETEFLLPIQLAFLIVLRQVDNVFFRQVVNGTASPADIDIFLRQKEKSKKYFTTGEWHVLSAMMIFEDKDQARRNQTIDALWDQHNRNSDFETKVKVNTIDRLSNSGYDQGRGFSVLAKKIDLAARINQ